MHAHLDSLALPDLVDRLADLEERRTPVGWSPDDAVERAGIERRILDMVSARPPLPGRTVPCRMEILLRSKQKAVQAMVREVRSGGLYVETDDTWIVGTHVDLEYRQNEWEAHGLRARGIITRLDDRGVLVSVTEQPSEAHERRLGRFVLELVHHHRSED
jgi:hypothetical protein